eukprot:scaffold2357_cov167-Amphora_coffeaeformis.AAC.36
MGQFWSAVIMAVFFCLNPTVGFGSNSISFSQRLSSLRATVPSQEMSGVSKADSVNPDMKAYAAGYKTVFNEVSCQTCKPSVGEIPSDLLGSYYKTGPAMFSAGSLYPPKTALVKPKQRPVPDNEIPERMVRHPFEGDGGILGVTFSGDGTATIRYRYVRTVGLFKECKVGRKRYTGMEATREMGADCAGGLGNFDWQLPLFRHHLLPGLNKLRKNTSNTRPIFWGKRLMNLWEGGQPFKMDAVSLQTEGKSLLGGAIKKDDRPFGSKMVYDSVKNRALFYGVDQGSQVSEITIYEFDDKFRLVKDKAGRYTADVPGCAILNDMAATENFAIFVQPPLTASLQFVFARDPGKTLKLGDGPSMLHLIPRVDSKKAQMSLSIPIDSDFLIDGNLLFCNSYEDPDSGCLVIDAVRPEKAPSGGKLPEYPWVDTMDNYRAGAGKKGLWRYTVDLQSKKVSKERLVSSDVSFAVINPDKSTQRHRYIYYNVGALDDEASPPQGIGRYDAETGTAVSWMPETHQFCGEPKYAARSGEATAAEDDGYILSVLFDGKGQESELLIFSASRVEQGPITRIPLGFGIPHGTFGTFTNDPEATWSEDVISRRAKLTEKIEAQGSLWNEVKSDFAGLG